MYNLSMLISRLAVLTCFLHSPLLVAQNADVLAAIRAQAFEHSQADDDVAANRLHGRGTPNNNLDRHLMAKRRSVMLWSRGWPLLFVTPLVVGPGNVFQLPDFP